MDITKFEQMNFKDRAENVPVPDLKTFFEEGEDPVWEIKGLTAHELAIVNNAVEANTGKNKLVDALTEGTSNEKVEAIRKAMNIIKLSDDVPNDLVRRHMTIVLGSVNPVCSEEMAVKLGTNFPTVLYLISQKIYGLTGLGRVGE
jgi:hypothetical protein